MGCMGPQAYYSPGTVRPQSVSYSAALCSLLPSSSNSYILSVLFKRLFLFKCNLPVLRFTNVLLSIILPPIITSLLARIRRQRAPESLLEPTTEALVLSLFPIAWFFGFLYYTEMGSLVLVLLCLQLSLKERQWAAAGVRFFYLDMSAPSQCTDQKLAVAAICTRRGFSVAHSDKPTLFG